MRKMIMLLALSAVCLSCSVREDRWGCPCILHMHASNELPEGDVLICASAGKDFVCQGIVSREDILSGTATLTVPRGSCRLTMAAGILSMSLAADGRLAINDGSPCDRLWSYSELVDVEGEEYHHTGMLHKNHAVLTLAIPGLAAGSVLKVEGTVNGYRTVDLTPVEGPFSCNPDAVPDISEYRLRIPRQIDESLKLSVYEIESQLKEIEIGKMLMDIGYDWSADDLLDIRLTVDLSKSKIDIRVADWDPVEFEIVEI